MAAGNRNQHSKPIMEHRNSSIVVKALCAAFGVAVLYGSRALLADDMDDFLKLTPLPEQPWLSRAELLIRAHPGDSRTIALRLRYILQLLGTDTGTAHFETIEKDLDDLIRDAGKSSDNVSFEAGMWKGRVYHDCLRNDQAAYEVYKGLEEHPWLSHHDTATDCQRVSLYVELAESAIVIKKPDVAEKYARLAMAYPYLGMEDRDLYQHFYDSYERAGNILLSTDASDLAKLRAIDIYPSHPRLEERRRRLVNTWVKKSGLDHPELGTIENISREAAEHTVANGALNNGVQPIESRALSVAAPVSAGQSVGYRVTVMILAAIVFVSGVLYLLKLVLRRCRSVGP